mmetsp:Transcript_9156/g.18567  ORF Transcript_9156/g.18567 Transcript_9156/m.18567 type:complete len:534 (-) Transcript_9156:2453-4054(-)|eukprot:CAMPEP_0184679186 /NCGR_PEP_ID=MMETSP0312-20130426/2008_1 /TAXON_ID=31354 /ORGANISM="Compsopogon coeruleus, Strain SAG 36.94" /LENGTH=533 /DNA_ID=CAMNT_0027128475 /DNA_START=826 /DNA_END=2427 /DNA_ORIENTATION=-
MFPNPILPGFYPDPSLCRVESDYFLVTSSFEYFPGLPIFHSRDLVHWHQIGHGITRASQIPLNFVPCSGGLFAATIRYNDQRKTFYIANTLVSKLGQVYETRNFVITARHAAGPWSDPIFLDDAPGIDPSLFFEPESGAAWICGNRIPSLPEYPGHCEIWIQELDLDSFQLLGESKIIWSGALKYNKCCEAPHIYLRNGWYYLIVAEGGTHHYHATSVARSRHIAGPYEGYAGNPILTHRHLGYSDYPIDGVGHADMVETPDGQWWLTCLGRRFSGGYFSNLGRETFLGRVDWNHDEWPVVNPGTGLIELWVRDLPLTSPCPWPPIPALDHFEPGQPLALHWNFIRAPIALKDLFEREHFIRLRTVAASIKDQTPVSFLGRRLQHHSFVVRTYMEFETSQEDECAGLVLLQSHNFHFRFIVDKHGVKLLKRCAPQDRLSEAEDIVVARKVATGTSWILQVECTEQSLRFSWGQSADQRIPLATDIDARILSTQVAGGFVGAYGGMYASGEGTSSSNHADFDYFEYEPIVDANQ